MMYVPTNDQILTVPRFNAFYRAPNNLDKLVSQIANGARNAADLDNSYIWRTIRAIAASPWNQSHIEYSTRGYENYNIEGPQYNRVYGLEPLAMPGTGNNYPVLWIPDPDSPLEPDLVMPPMIAPSVEIIAAQESTEIPPEIVAELADPTRETLILEPANQEAADIAAGIPEIATEAQAAAIQAADTMLTSADQILSDPTAPISDKIQAVATVAELAKETELAPADTIDETAQNAISLLEANQAAAQAQAAAQVPPDSEPDMFASLGPILASMLASRWLG